MLYLIFNSRTEFDTFREQIAPNYNTQGTDPELVIGEPAYENPGDEETPPSGMVFCAHNFTEEQAAWLVLSGCTLRVGDPDGPDWPVEEGI